MKQLTEENENKPVSQLKLELPILYINQLQCWSIPAWQNEKAPYLSLAASPDYPVPVTDFFHPPV
jgi:hypothetical protein